MNPQNLLSSTYKELSLLWHPTMNGKLTPNNVSATSALKVWWQCQVAEDHSWNVTVRNLVIGEGKCPYCAGYRVLAGFNDLSTTHPSTAEKWHPTKNGSLTPQQFKAGSNKKVWWQCKLGHAWETIINSVVNATGIGCPVCSGKRILSGFNDLATLTPEVLTLWHPTKNSGLTPTLLSPGSNKKIWWQCKLGHEWHAVISSIARQKTGCPFCSGSKILTGYNDLSTTHSDIDAQWHPTKNGDLQATQVSSGSSKKAWWICPVGHEWEAIINNIAAKKSNCIYCSGKETITGFNDLTITHPLIANKWHPTKNGDLSANQVKYGSHKKVWWQCPEDHEWSARIYTQADTSCPYCYGRYVIPGENDLGTVYPNAVKEWHPTRNGDKTPQNTMSSTPKKIWWICSEGHEWEASPNTRFSKGAYAGCSYCSGIGFLEGFNDLATTHPNTVKEWHPTKNKDKPNEVKKSSEERVWWICDAGHEWKAGIYSRAVMGTGCAACCGKRVNPGVTDLVTLNPTLAAQWHPTKNGDLAPDQIAAFSGLRVWWQCPKGHEWETPVSNRHQGRNCAKCNSGEKSSKAEKELIAYVQSLGVITDLHTRKILKGKELDIYIPAQKLAIEFNGLYWHTEESGKPPSYHYDKWKNCRDSDIELIQVWEDHWNENPESVKKFISFKLGIGDARVTNKPLDTKKLMAKELSQQEAEKFLTKNHILGFSEAEILIGLVAPDSSLHAVLTANWSDDGRKLDIAHFSSVESHSEALKNLLAYADNAYKPKQYSVIDNHSYSQEELWIDQGFLPKEEVKPDFMYFRRKERFPQLYFTLERFKQEPKLDYEEDLTIKELTILNGLRHIWDAGHTVYTR